MKDDQGIIILGCPRSGTTLLRRLLDAHPDLCCPGETFLFRGCSAFLDADIISHGFEYGPLSALEGLGFTRQDTVNRLHGFATGFYRDIARRAGKKHWVAKTAVDSFYIPAIETLFAGRAKFIAITRHGLDVVCSMEEFVHDLQSYVRELHSYLIETPQPLEAFAHVWADVTTDILDFVETHGADCHLLKYEDLAAEPDAEMKKITDFLGISPLAGDSSALLEKKTVDGIGDWKSYQKSKVETASVARWQQQLPAPAIDRLAPIVNEVLARAGYPAVSSGSNEDARRRQELAMMMMQAKKE
jgi:hypothetical protein